MAITSNGNRYIFGAAADDLAGHWFPMALIYTGATTAGHKAVVTDSADATICTLQAAVAGETVPIYFYGNISFNGIKIGTLDSGEVTLLINGHG
jgi:hypothetical protein